MGFIWIQNIGIGADIDSADIVEIRDAADFVLDNLCVVDNIGEDVGHDGLDLGAEDGLDQVAEDGVENSDHNPAENGEDDTADDGAVDSDHNPALNTTNNPTEDSAALPANQAPDNVGEDGGDRNPHYLGALDGEDTFVYVHNSPDRDPYFPGYVGLEWLSDKDSHRSNV